MSKKPTQVEIATALQVSPGRISQLVKDGMPTYSVEAAAAWKKQHVAPIMTKARSVAAHASGPASAAPAGASRQPSDSPQPSATLASVEALGGLVDAALLAGKVTVAGIHVAALRDLLRNLPEGLSPRLPVRVWVALLDYLLADDVRLRTLHDQAAPLTPAEVAANIGEPGVWSAALVLDDACDWYDWSLEIDNAAEVDA